MNYFEVNKKLKEKSTLCHFTTYETAINHILDQKKMRLSPRGNMNDPNEKFIPLVGQSVNYPSGDDGIEKRNKDNVNRIEMVIENIFTKAKQVSFCKNHNKTTSKDKYCYSRLRMWDQYADNFKGVCLIFDKNKLAKESKFIKDDVEYINFKNMEDTINVDMNDLDEYGIEYERFQMQNARK